MNYSNPESPRLNEQYLCSMKELHPLDKTDVATLFLAACLMDNAEGSESDQTADMRLAVRMMRPMLGRMLKLPCSDADIAGAFAGVRKLSGTYGRLRIQHAYENFLDRETGRI